MPVAEPVAPLQMLPPADHNGHLGAERGVDLGHLLGEAPDDTPVDYLVGRIAGQGLAGDLEYDALPGRSRAAHQPPITTWAKRTTWAAPSTCVTVWLSSLA